MKPTTLSLAWRSGCLDLRVAVDQGKAIAHHAIRAMALSFPGASRCSGVNRRRRRCPAACYVIRGVRVASLAGVTRINLAASPESTTCTFGRAAARARSVLPQAGRRWRSGGCAAPHLRTGWTRALQMRIT